MGGWQTVTIIITVRVEEFVRFWASEQLVLALAAEVKTMLYSICFFYIFK